jgi:hypothetical protein
MGGQPVVRGMPAIRLKGKVIPRDAPMDRAGLASGTAMRMAAGAAM